MADYIKKLKDPRWQKKRLNILNRDEFTCQKCFDNESTLNVHHKYYLNGNDPWDYPDEALITLCEECHKEEKEYIEDLNKLIIKIKTYILSYNYNSLEHIIDYIFKYSPVNNAEVIVDIVENYVSDPENVRRMANLYFDKIKSRGK